jgi:predicted RNase H-like nuclease (RuvC/YqgF family)
MIKLKFPDGSVKECIEGITGLEVAESIKSANKEIAVNEKQFATVQPAQAALQAKITTATDKMKTLKAENKKIKTNSPVDKEMKALKQEITEAEKQLAAAKVAQPDPDTVKAKITAAKDRVKGLNESIKAQKATMSAANTATSEGNVFRVMFFVFTFFTIGIVSNFKKLWEEGIGRLMVVYVVALFGFIIWVGLFISWLFFHGVMPPLAG